MAGYYVFSSQPPSPPNGDYTVVQIEVDDLVGDVEIGVSRWVVSHADDATLTAWVASTGIATVEHGSDVTAAYGRRTVAGNAMVQLRADLISAHAAAQAAAAPVRGNTQAQINLAVSRLPAAPARGNTQAQINLAVSRLPAAPE